MPPPTPRPAIPAAKNRLGDQLIYWGLARWALWSQFHTVWLQTDGPLPAPAQGPVICYLNHSAWWDGYLMYVIDRAVLGGGFDSYLLMEERQLRAYRFFTWSGAFSINRHSPKDSHRSQQYAADLLRGRRDRMIYMFPQGKIVPNDQRPLVTYPGIARIIALAGDVALCPVALRYEFLGQQLPHAFIRIGPLHRPEAPADQGRIMAAITARLTASVDALRDEVVAGRLGSFRPVLRGNLGIDQAWDRARGLFMRRKGG